MSHKNIICQVCNRALDRYASPSGVSYVHSPADYAPHDPVPVEAPSGWRGKCDFCSVDKPEFLVPARDFRLPYLQNRMSLGDWAACLACAMLVDSNRWSELERRVATTREAHGGVLGEDERAYIRALYRALRKAINSTIRPIGGAG